MRLTPENIEAATPAEKDYKLSDGKGMYLLVTKAGSKSFRLKYRLHGKEKKLVLGTHPEIDLDTARKLRDEAKKLIRNGVDPSAKKKAEREAAKALQQNSFELIAREWFEVRLSNKTEGHQRRVIRALENHLFPDIGDKPIHELTAPVLLPILRQIENRGSIETAHRVKQITSQIFCFAISTGRADRDPTVDLKGALRHPPKKHFSALTHPKDVGRLMVAIDSYTGTTIVKCALKLSALFFCRPGELRHMKWSDINVDQKRIELVAEKTRQPHIIPISKQAISVLQQLHQQTGNGTYVFPSARGTSRCMSENAVRTALRTMGYDNNSMTPHGFRAMARTLLDEELGVPIEWIEQQLAHAVKDPNGRAYNRTKHLAQRAEMMQDWADYLDSLKASALSGQPNEARFETLNTLPDLLFN